MYDLIVTRGSVADEYSVQPLDIAVKGERIVALGAHGQFDDLGAQRVVDASGKFVLPGGVDPHVHYDFSPSPLKVSQTARAGSRAGLWGGTTTYIDFSFARNGQSLLESIDDKFEATNRQQLYSDYALHSIMSGDWPQSNVEEIPEAINRGVSSFKFFTTFKAGAGKPSLGTELMSDDGRIYSAMLEAGKHGAIVMVHCEDDSIIDYNVRRLYREGREHFSNIAEARPPLAEEMAVRRMLLLAERAGCPLYVVHVSAQESVAAIDSARERIPVFAEVLHSNLVFDPELYNCPNGQRFMNYPPNKTLEHRQVLWDACLDGRMSTVASDDNTLPWAVKIAGDKVDNVTGGTNSVETRMPVLWSEGVVKRGMSIPRFVALTAANPAKIFGIYGRKGVIRVGADADLVVFDGSRPHTFQQDVNLHSDGEYSNWDGYEVTGVPVVVVLRGHLMIENDALVGPEGVGRFVPSGISERA